MIIELISMALSVYAEMVLLSLPVMGILGFHVLNIIVNFVLPRSSVNKGLYSWYVPSLTAHGVIQSLVKLVEFGFMISLCEECITRLGVVEKYPGWNHYKNENISTYAYKD